MNSDSDIFVCVHGISRNAASQLFRFRQLSEDTGALLITPTFSKKRFRHYQTLQPSGCGRRPDLELIRLIDNLRDMFGLHARAVRMFGYSGGGQFACRFAMRHPSLVERLMLAAPGWYTFPDMARAYPYGAATKRGEISIDLAGFLATPIDVVVGARDIVRDKTFNQTADIDEAQGRTRLERAKNWVAAVRSEAARREIPADVALHVLERGIHSFEQNMNRCELGALVKDQLFPELEQFESCAIVPRTGKCAR